MESPTFEELFRQIKINFRILGMPFDNPKHSFKFFIPYFSLSLVLLQESIFFISEISSDNFLELAQLSACMLIGFLSLIKIFCIYIKKNKVVEITRNLDKLYDSISNDPNDFCYIKANIIQMKMFNKYFFVLNFILISMFNFSSPIIIVYQYLQFNKWQFTLPYSVYVPFRTDTFFNWFIVYLHLIVAGFITTLFFSTTDSLYFNLTFQLCNSYTVLGKQVKSLKPKENENLRVIIKKHQYILGLSEDLEDIFSGPNFFNVLFGSLLICALGFNLTTGDLAQLPSFAVFLSSVLLQILMMSKFGEDLLQKSQEIGDAAFLTKWYDMDASMKKSIMILKQRSLRPQRLTALKFSVISYKSFAKIISTSWSYFTLLQTAYKPTETAKA